jgi:hypothetical protein
MCSKVKRFISISVENQDLFFKYLKNELNFCTEFGSEDKPYNISSVISTFLA